MSILIDTNRYRDVDLPVFQAELDAFLPDSIYDSHVHVVLPEHVPAVPPEAVQDSWAAEAPHELSLDELEEVQAYLFPGRRVGSLAFTMPVSYADIEAGNAYIASGIAAGRIDGLLVVRPEWPQDRVLDLIRQGGFVGFKPYPGLVGSRTDDAVSIDDYFPPAHQEIADELGLIALIHLPRPERLRDPRNLDELHKLVSQRPSIRVIVAHIGRAYTMSFAEPGLRALRDLPTLYHDFAMNLNADVIELALQEIGPERLLYGSDLPICLMRGVREHRGDEYVNFSDGEYTWNTPERRKPSAVEARYTLYIYEELRAFKTAAERMGLTAAQVAVIMGGNAQGLVAAARQA